MDSKIGLIIQLSGVCLITMLTLFLRRTLNFVALRQWTHAWLFMSFSLFCLRLAFSYEQYSMQLFGFYFLTQYIFGFLLVAGCRSLSDQGELPIRQELLLMPFILIAFGLPFTTSDLSLIVDLHSAILSVFFIVAFYELWRTKIGTFGWRVMLIAIGLLAADLLQYSVIFGLRQYIDITADYLAYSSVIDLVLQILLGFGMVIVLLELVLSDAKVANEKLRKAHEKLEELAHIDPLTTALNRHAFHGYLRRNDGLDDRITGSVGFFDIDDLKDINDRYGHAAGDMAIRAVVRAIRELIRAEDLIFRWGGDEFFVIMIGLDANGSIDRMQKMDDMLATVSFDSVARPLAIRVSRAFVDFDGLEDIEAAIEKADANMYLQKQARKRQMSPSPLVASIEDGNLIPIA